MVTLLLSPCSSVVRLPRRSLGPPRRSPVRSRERSPEPLCSFTLRVLVSSWLCRNYAKRTQFQIGKMTLTPCHKKHYRCFSPTGSEKNKANQSQFIAAKPDSPPRRFTLHASRFTPHASRFTLHASRLTLHASRFTLHASRLTLHASRFTRYEIRPPAPFFPLYLTPIAGNLDFSDLTATKQNLSEGHIK